MNDELLNWLLDASAWVLPVLFAITLHEMAHGWMAEKFGDDTARRAGRITLNPLKHIDRFGTVILPAMLLFMRAPFVFGYAEPVPVDFERLKPERFGTIMVALAGPLSNLLQALIAALLLHVDLWVTPEEAPWLFQNLYRALMINSALLVLNLLPIMPLDGGRVVAALMPGKHRQTMLNSDKIGLVLILVLLMLGPLLGLDVAETLIGKPAMWLTQQLLFVTGNG